MSVLNRFFSKKAQDDISKPMVEQLTVTLVSNNFYNNLNSVKAYKTRDALFIEFNADVRAYNATSEFVQIATISGWNAVSSTYATVPLQADSTKEIVLYIYTNGGVYLYTKTGTVTSATRTSLSVPRQI